MRWLLFYAFYILLAFYAAQAVRTVNKHAWIGWGLSAISLGILIYFTLQFTVFSESRGLSVAKNYAIGFVLIAIVAKLVIVLFLFGEDLIRGIIALLDWMIGSKKQVELPGRRKFVSTLALGVAAVPLLSMLYGIYRGKYNYKVLRYTLEFEDLPAAFDGYQITQLSDMHCGSFDNEEKIRYGIDLVNQQQSDAIVFTGDMVNNTADELEKWQHVFKELHAKDGLFSVLGNHDYGDYVPWENKEAKAANLDRLKALQKDIGFDLLCNEHRYLHRGEEKIALVGVENWGKGFKQKGDLKKATQDIADKDFKVLLSHDPTHWELQAVPDELFYHLTLSGHTHGMQFGIEIPGWIKWSPVKWRYKYWAGVYQKAGQYLNVNRGFGYLAFPGRVGIWPEITVFTLKKKQMI
ncbi:MAG: metallophosphoesterase [Flavobacteriaceae bacterium]|nr:metallophosphoesterase [Flavobacteriaceae bacterium]